MEDRDEILRAVENVVARGLEITKENLENMMDFVGLPTVDR